MGSGVKAYALTAGDIAIIAVNTDAVKTMTFVALTDIPANTSISFTDNAWNAANTGVWRTGEGTITWSNTAITNKGTAVNLTVNATVSSYTTSVGTVSTDNNFNLSGTGDQILAYESTVAPTTNTDAKWLYGFSIENWVYGNNTNTSDIPTALIGFTSAMTTSTTETDNAYFANASTVQTAVTVTGTKAELLTLFTDVTKYYQNNTGPLALPTYSITVNADVVPTTPTITVTEVTIPEMVAFAGETKTEVINVSGINLTESIILAVTGTDASLFELSNTNVPQTAGTAPSTAITIKYKPVTPGTHTATLTLSSTNATSITKYLTGSSTWKPLDAPVATEATASNVSGFAANWNEVVGATEYQLNVYSKSLVPSADLFISEYSEGSSNNKYMEIYNGTGSSVNLAAYVLKQSNNGTGWPTDVNATTYLPLTGTLASGEVYVLANGQADATILALADVSITYSTTTQGGTVLGFNGNDAVGLFKNDVLIDLVGDPAVTTNFDIAGVAGASADHTMVRKATVSSGNTNWTLSAGTDETSSEWVVSAQNTWTFLGSHVYGGLTNSHIAGSPFTVTGATTKALTGLDAGTTYYYTVIAKNANVSSEVSNEIIGATLGTSLDNTTSDLTVISVNGNINFSALAGESVEVYSALGQKLVQKLTVNGLNTIPVSARGVVLVKVGNRFAKVIL